LSKAQIDGKRGQVIRARVRKVPFVIAPDEQVIVNPIEDASVYELDPLVDSRWEEFLYRQPNASVFHSREWLRALHTAYGYEPVAITDSPPECPLISVMVFCRVVSRITGKRLVSLPFSDHCDPLCESTRGFNMLASYAAAVAKGENYKYVEIRPIAAMVPRGFQASKSYYYHQVDLMPGADLVYRKLHVDCIQRKIRRAERENLTFRSGTTAELMETFYKLHTHTRLRHGLPPQPRLWFNALFTNMQRQISIKVAYFEGKPVASVITLEGFRTTVYKYGCSDESYNRLGGAQALMWEAIEEACNKGHTVFDMGRSDLDQLGLIEYKDRWGARKSLITYYRSPCGAAKAQDDPRAVRLVKRLFSNLPESVAPFVGRLIYRHLA
jgi:CelD/BcsL family acetyltransferase involved in cellulose biosynthesis